MSNELESKSEVSFKGKLTFGYYKKFSFYHVRKKFLLILPILFIALTILFSRIFDTNIILLPLFFSIITASIPIIVFYIRIEGAYYSDSLLKLEQSYVADTDGICIKTEQTNAKFLWSDIIAGKEYKDMFILYVSKIKAIIIPKSFFSKEEDIKHFKSLIIEKLKFFKV